MDNARLVLPGEIVGMASEKHSGEGVYEDGEYLRSEYLGRLVDRGDMVEVRPIKRPPVPRRGSIIIGYILAIIRGRILQIQVLNLDGELVQPFTAIVHVPDDIISADAYARVGDFVKAKIVDEKRLVATMEEEDLGVILARCGRCNTPMMLEDESKAGGVTKLKCPVCGNEETRKVAKDYNAYAKIALEKSLEFIFLDTYRQIPLELKDETRRGTAYRSFSREFPLGISGP